MTEVIHHVIEYHVRDGIGNDIRGFNEIFNTLGIESSVFCKKNLTRLKVLSREELLQRSTKETIHIFHYSGVGFPIDLFLQLTGKKVLRFHNFTPAFAFDYPGTQSTEFLKWQHNRIKIELIKIGIGFDYFLFNSIFSLNVFSHYVPLIVRKDNFTILPIVKKYKMVKRNESINTHTLSFVGRFVPSKNIHSLIRCLYYLKKFNENYRLNIIGKRVAFFDRYYSYLKKLAADTSLSSSIDWLEDIDETTKEQKIQTSDIFLTLSRHEGFCIPILDSFASGVLTAFSARSAMPETSMSAGVHCHYDDPALIAATIHKLNTNLSIKKKIIEKQYRVAKYYNSIDFPSILKSLVSAIDEI